MVIALLLRTASTANFTEVGEAPVARFHKIGTVTPNAIFGHIIISFNVSEIRRQTTELQAAIASNKDRASTENRARYDDLSETLATAQRELDDDMGFFTVLTRKARSFGEWLGGVLGLWNSWEIHSIKELEDSTRKALMLEAHHVDALQTYAESTQDDLKSLADRISRQGTLVWSRVDDITEESDINRVVAPVRAISSIAATLPSHRLDPAVLDVVEIGKVWDSYAEKTEAAGWYIALDGWQDIFHLPTSYHATTDVLTLAVRLPLVREKALSFALLSPTFFPIMHGDKFYDISTDEEVLAWEDDTETYLGMDRETLERCIQAGDSYFCNEAMVVMQGTPQTCLSSIWMGEWEAIRARCRLWSRPATSSAQRINATHTVVTAPGTTEVQVRCSGRPTTVRAVSGQWWLAMEAGCTASTATWEITSRVSTTVEAEMVVVSFHTNRTTWVGGEEDFSVNTPTPVHSITHEIMDTLREGESSVSGYVILALGVAAAAVAVVASFIFYSYIKFRQAGMSGVCEAAGASVMARRARSNSV